MRWWLALVLCGCGVVPMTPDAGTCASLLTLGTTISDGGFVPLTNGLELEVVQGPQGGFHVFVGAEVNGLPKMGSLDWRLESMAGQTLASRALDVSTLRLEDVPCGWRRPRDLLVFDDTDQVPMLRGVPATLRGSFRGLERSFTIAPR
jgi:hypothetical protein